MKVCSKCQIEKPLADYPPDKQNLDGRKGKCRSCVSQRQRELRAEKPERDREWVQRNHETVLASKRAYRQKNADRLRIESRIRQRKRREDPNVQESHREYASVYARIHKKQRKPSDHVLAREAVNKALKSGRLKKPDCCAKCRCSGLIHGHHPSYEKDRWLDVIWLCTKCHGLEHRMADSVIEIRKAG